MSTEVGATQLSDAEALALLDAIGVSDSVETATYDVYGGIETIPSNEFSWEDKYCGNVEFTTKLGHVVVVFNDCVSWDYIDHIRSADGRRWDWPPSGPDISYEKATWQVIDWAPTVERSRWGRDVDEVV